MLSDYIKFNPAPHPLSQPCGLDALHLAIPQDEPFPKRFVRLRDQLAHPGRKEDYRLLGLPVVVLHPDPMYGKKASRILQIIGVGRMGRAAILDVLRCVVDCNLLALKIKRLDLTADWIGTTVNDVRKSMKVKWKRNIADYTNSNPTEETFKVQCHETGRYETLYYGSSKSKDFVRVYDKCAQLRKAGGVSAEILLPTPWVRFERVLARNGVPAELATLGDLFANGAAYDPFASVEIIPAFDVAPEMLYEWNAPNVTLKDQQNAAYTLWTLQRYGYSEAMKQLRTKGRKPKQMFELLNRALDGLAVPMPTTSELTARFQTSFERQLFADPEAELPESDFEKYRPITMGITAGVSPHGAI